MKKKSHGNRKNHTFECRSVEGMEARRKEQGSQRKSSKEMNSGEMQRKWMKQWFERGVLGNLNVTFATQEALIGDRVIEPRVKGLGSQGERK